MNYPTHHPYFQKEPHLHNKRITMNTKTKGILAYLVIAFGVAWIIWEMPIQKGLTVDELREIYFMSIKIPTS